ncbi:MAG: Ig-like domain-containing protein, partial [Acidimicrobiia bacterium]|nr:Ig-like domain-containing protein [Acidimicrobiia bacterium]
MNRTRSRWSHSGVVIVLAILLVGVSPAPAQAAVIRPFTPRFSLNTTGAITLTGNTLLTCPPAATSCLGARMGTGSTTVNNNNNYSMIFVDVDTDATTFNSSRNTLSIPATSTVLWAGLYWGADTSAGGGSGAAAPNAAARQQILLQPPGGGGYVTLTASQLDSSPVAGGFRYQGFVDVTNLVTAGRSGEYTVANLQAGRGTDRYGGWALVVAYQDPTEPVRNLTVFDGYAVVQQTPSSDQNVPVPVSGFLTPPSGQVRSRVGVVSYEGDLGLLGDSLRLNATPLTNSLNPATNFFNSSLTSLNGTITTGNPFFTNMLGFDVDTIRADGVLANGATSATINLNTNSDTYFPGVVSFSTELFSPRLDLDKSAVDLNGGSLDPGDQILYTMQVANGGDDGAASVVFSDEIPSFTSYVPGSLLVDGLPVTDTPGDDVGELAAAPDRVVARLGTGASAVSGGVLTIGATRTVSFRVTVGTVPVDEVITNAATATYIGATSGLPLAAISNTVTLSPRPMSDLSILKFGPDEPTTVPGTIAYQLIVTNRGPAPEPTATVTDVLPAGFVVSSATPSQGTCSTGATVSCNLGGLAVGATATVDIFGTVAAGSGQITNTASVDGANLDILPNNNLATAVAMLNNPPAAIDQAAATASGTPVVVPVLTGASDPDGDPLTTATAGPAANGSIVIGDGTVTYTPDPGFKGVDTFTFTISDGQGGFDTAVVTVTVANAPPVAVDDAAATPPAAPVTVTVLANDSDPNGDPLTVTSVTQPAGGATTGVVVLNPDGTITFTPAAPFRGNAVFTYSITDGTDPATATVTIQVPDQAPAAVDDAVITPAGTPVVVAVLANDIDPNADPISVVPASLSVPTSGGTVVLNGDDTVTYTPPVGFKGIDTFTYEVTDGLLTSPGTVMVTVSNAPPVAVDDTMTAPPGTPVVVIVTTNDSDPNGDGLTVIDVSPPAAGSAVVNPDGTVTYTPAPGFKGIDSFTYTVSDGTDTATATVSVTVSNTPPRPANDS